MRKWVWIAVIFAALVTGYAVGYFFNPAGVPPVKGYLDHLIRSQQRRLSNREPEHLGTALRSSAIIGPGGPPRGIGP